MPNIFESCLNKKDFDNLQNIKNNLLKAKEDKEKENQKKFIENYRKHHIFNSYEEALNWSIKNPNKKLQWHCKSLFWQEDKNQFKSYEQEYDLNGIMCYDVIKYYTKEELLKSIKEYQNNIPHFEKQNWWLDEFNKLKYVNI